MKSKYDFIDNLRLEVIATYDNEPQEMFSIGITDHCLRSEDSMIDFIRSALDGDQDELVKLSLCWKTSEKLFAEFSTVYSTIRNCSARNGKYLFNAWADEATA